MTIFAVREDGQERLEKVALQGPHYAHIEEATGVRPWLREATPEQGCSKGKPPFVGGCLFLGQHEGWIGHGCFADLCGGFVCIPHSRWTHTGGNASNICGVSLGAYAYMVAFVLERVPFWGSRSVRLDLGFLVRHIFAPYSHLIYPSGFRRNRFYSYLVGSLDSMFFGGSTGFSNGPTKSEQVPAEGPTATKHQLWR